MSPTLPPYEIFRIYEVVAIVKVGRSTIYSWMKQGKFPKQLRLGSRAVGWSSKAVFQWLAEREAA
ncbi:AlpA family phage regulatory protein [Rhodanobacter sp. OR87]|uniref:helix-turn-helix transcriptional regulator n=1 Tax=Rhodanobacter sp. OR87 TaxID=1076523 RepID=UPI0009DF9B42|nr:AlpA family phage regulatory protein [Rhodanobacter sp. OR87]